MNNAPMNCSFINLSRPIVPTKLFPRVKSSPSSPRRNKRARDDGLDRFGNLSLSFAVMLGALVLKRKLKFFCLWTLDTSKRRCGGVLKIQARDRLPP
jgi:hypothetical protein